MVVRGVVAPGLRTPNEGHTAMRIAQIAPLQVAVPPRSYRGTERVVHALTDGLMRLGHEVTLFATGDSRTSARLVPMIARAVNFDPAIDITAVHVAALATRARLNPP